VSASTGPVIAAGAITLFNDVIVHSQPFSSDLRVAIGTAVVAIGLSGLEHLAPDLAVAFGWMLLVVVLFTRTKAGVPSPAEAFATWYKG